MHKRHKYDIIIVLSVIGFAVSLFLAITHYLGFAVPCDITKGCEVVLNSKYSILLGLPLAVWGVGFYGAIIVCALLANHYGPFRRLLTWLLGAGAIGSGIFLYIQFFVLGKACQYCLLVDLLTIGLFLWDLNIEHGFKRGAEPP